MKIKTVQSLLLSLCFFIFCIFPHTSCCTQRKVPDNLLELDEIKYRKRLKHNKKFFDSAKVGDLQGVQEALERGKANINSSDRLGQSAFMWASWMGNEEIVQYLLQFDDKLRLKKKKSEKLLAYTQETRSKYNSLFCLISSVGMDSQNAIECIKTLLGNEKRWTGKQKLLYKVDSLKENVLHKATRAGNVEVMQCLIDFLKSAEKNKGMKFSDILESQNKDGDTPLILAIKARHPQIVRLLIKNDADINVNASIGRRKESISLLAFDEGKGDYYTFLEVLKGILSRCKEEEMQGIHESQKKYRREDKELEEKIIEYIDAQYGQKVQIPFYFSYARLAKDKVATEEELEDATYRSIVNDFFARLRKSNFRLEDLEELEEIIKESPFVLTQKYRNDDLHIEESALEIAIKNGNYDVFNLIFAHSDMSKLPDVSLGYINYFICAIVHGRDKIVRRMLEYNEERNGAVEGKLMSPYKISFNDRLFPDKNTKTANAVVAFLKNERMRAKQDLLHKVLLYYRTQYSNAGVVPLIFNEVLTYNDEDFLLLLYKYSKHRDGFYLVYKVQETNTFLPFYYLEKGYYKALKLFVEHNRLNDDEWDITDENDKTFLEVLEERENDESLRPILELWEK